MNSTFQLPRVSPWCGVGLSVICALANTSRLSAQICEPMWSDAFRTDGVDRTVTEFTSFDEDGSGGAAPVLIAAGDFQRIGGLSANRIAKWNGALWTPLGDGFLGSVDAVVTFDQDGEGPEPESLFAAGRFGTVTQRRVARWNGTGWSALGSGFNGTVHALTVADTDGNGPLPPSLVAGGTFTTADGQPVLRIARWNGSQWQQLGAGFSSSVRALTTLDEDGPGPQPPRLFAGGSFAASGSAPMEYVARWSGAAWEAVGPAGTGPAGSVAGLVGLDEDDDGPQSPVLYAGGSVYSPTGTLPGRVMKWNGVAWAQVGPDMNAGVEGIGAFDPDGDGPLAATAVIAGSFQLIGSDAIPLAAMWNGSRWTQLGSGLQGIRGWAVHSFDPDDAGPLSSLLVVGGSFEVAGEHAAKDLAAWDGLSWSPIGGPVNRGMGYTTSVVTSFDEDGPGGDAAAMFAGGVFLTAGGALIEGFARWRNGEWSAIDEGTYRLSAFHVRDDDGSGPIPLSLFVGGALTNAKGETLHCIARWDGNDWTPLGEGLNSVPYAMVDFDEDNDPETPPVLIVGGHFTMASGQPANRVARWDGSAWSALGAGFSWPVRALATFDDDGAGPNPPQLFAAAEFTSGIYRWTGTSWATVGEFDDDVTSMVVFDADDDGPNLPALYAGGHFNWIDGMTIEGLARWDGSMWSAVDGGLNSWVETMSVFDDDGAGPRQPALYVGGYFNLAGGAPAHRVARWDGRQWSALGSGLNDPPISMHGSDLDGSGPMPPMLFMSGWFTWAGQQSSMYVAAWNGCHVAPCLADIGGGDGAVDVNDLLVLIGGWGPCPSPCPPCPADIVADCTVDVNDLLALIGAWGPCP